MSAEALGIPREEFAARQEEARRACAARGLAALLVVGRAFYDRPGSLAYLTNHFPPFPTAVVSGAMRGLGHAALLLPQQGAPILVADGPAVRRDLVAVEAVEVSSDLPRALAGVVQGRGLATARIGLAGADILPLTLFREMAAALPAVTWEPAEEIVNGMRQVKSPAEQDLLRQAAAVAAAGLAAAVSAVKPGVSEREVCAAGVGAALLAGADFVRYLRVHSGPWATWTSRWPQATDRVIGQGEMVTLDLIGARQGYQFDVLRTTVAGEVSPEQRRLLEAGLEATTAAVEAARPGVPAEHLVAVAHDRIAAAGFGGYARPFAGHAIGLETVEEPYLLPGVATPLRPGMALCVEPGIYVPELGGVCVEQEILVTEGRPEVITHAPTRLW
jgi:Xaa-Pro dipeptidase